MTHEPNDWEGEERRSPRTWHLEKSLNLGHLLTTLTLAVAVVGAWNKMDARLQMLEAFSQRQQTIDDRQDAERLRREGEIRHELELINQKLDRLIQDRRSPRNE